MDKSIRKITKLGKWSYGITLPIDIVRKLKWKERQKVVVKLRGKKISIEDWPGSTKPKGEGGKK